MTVADEAREVLERATGENLPTDEDQIQAIMRLSAGALGHAEAADDLRIMRDEFLIDGTEMV